MAYTLFKTRNEKNSNNYINIDFDKGGRVSGYLLEPLEIGSDAKYETFFNLDGKLGLAGEILGFFGNVQIGKAGFWTRQYYRGGSYIKIDGKLRIVNWDDSSDVVSKAVRTMIGRCMPTQSIDKDTANKQILSLANTISKKEKDNAGKTDEVIEQEEKDKYTNTVVKLKNQGVAILDDLIKGSPSKLSITTNYMKLTEMVLSSVSATYSKEVLQNGWPLYADISFSCMQLEIKTNSEVRGMLVNNKPKVRLR
jgi:hypothetical protein